MANNELFARIKSELHTPVLGDILDEMGRHVQFLPPEIKAIVPDTIVVGRAMPVLIADIYGHSGKGFGRLMEAIDALEEGEIYFARNSRNLCAAWGEIMASTAIRNGAVGAVIDGHHRDTRQVKALNFPTFSRGAYGQDAKDRATVLDFRLTVEVGGVIVHPGDLVVGDNDGVIVVPQDVEAEVLERAFNKVSKENLVLKAIQDGMSAVTAYDTFGVF